ncbi:MAG: carboxy-S-adenosyl-L-methionine synthase CmoA [Methylococcales bacterium]|jgi:tRNA (cmo5U34)-methyltransferase|nr:carboxy-S-adenosyl-L-methionine synthase CmoA [Methylococcaceae bacterium]HIL40851.1 carboxy-S-adenosyl-L-methionine synthase CmoA [Methylococcales bacterium]
MASSVDSIFSKPLAEVADFKFDASVVTVFPDMIQRSVPGYRAMISAIGLLSERFVQPDSLCYDLGCSLGAATLSMRHQITERACEIIAVDNSAAMVEQCQRLVNEDDGVIPVQVIEADVREIVIEKASVVVLNFTLQFLPRHDRLALLTHVFQGLLPGGILILSEKLRFSDDRQNELHTDMHHIFKKANGYSDLEISQKRLALDNILLPETLVEHQERLRGIGFESSEVWFQYFNFASILALK